MAAVDRISELPESILHRILSFLSYKQAIQTSVLSKPWRHVGPTGPKIELREDCFFKKSGRATFLSVLGKTLQRYNHQNLSVHEFILEMSESSPDNHLFMYSESISVLDKAIRALLTTMAVKKFDFSVPRYVLDPSLVFKAEFLTELYLSKCIFMTSATTFTNDHYHGEPLLKGLKRLSLRRVSITEETFVQIMLSCPLIEYLRVSDCPGLTTIPETIFQAESLTQLDLRGCRLTISMCSCPLIEHVVLSDCNDPHGICLNCYGHNKYFLPRLKSLCLTRVKLSAELFESLSSNFPSLEELQLRRCYGFSEIQLKVCSIKRLHITIDSSKCMILNINAPNIHCFELSVRALPELIFHTETAREWNSRIVVFSNDNVLLLPWLLQLRELLISLRESQISLDVYPDPYKDLKVENTDDVAFCNPVPLQCVCVKADDYRSSFSPEFLDYLLLICRPRYIGDMNWYTTTNLETGWKKGKNKLAVFIISEIIRNQGEMNRGYVLWERDLEEISMQVWYRNSKRWSWHSVRVEEKGFPRFKSSDTKMRFRLKWRSKD